MKKNLVFFPGKGIYSLPDGTEVVSVYKTKEAREIFDALSYYKQNKSFPKELSTHLRTKALTLKSFYEQRGIDFNVTSSISLKQTPPLIFDKVIPAGTRVSVGEDVVDWEHISNSLEPNGFILSKREYMDNSFDNLCPVWYLHNKTTGVMSEGKGLTQDQAKKSALGEGLERIVAMRPNKKMKKKVCVDTYQSLYRSKSWDLGELVGSRDLFSEKQITEWVPAKNISRDEDCFVPAELSYFEYIPEKTNTRLFSLHHTMGLAAGTTVEDATLSGLFEVLERDAYWITMRCRINCPDIELNKIEDLDPEILTILRVLKKKGFEVVLKDMSLDWGIPIAHAVLIDANGGMPAFSHGTGASFDWNTSISRAVCEVLQMYSGMDALINTHFEWEEVVSVQGVLGRAELAWSDPLYEKHIRHLVTPSEKTFQPRNKVRSVASLLRRLQRMGHEVVVANLESDLGLSVVRVFVTNATQPDTRLEKIGSRLEKWMKKEGLQKGFYSDPILT